jgi:hypothetical protein
VEPQQEVTRRTLRRLTAQLSAAAALVAGVLLLTLAPAAEANSGWDFCLAYSLPAGHTCWSSEFGSQYTVYETEGWDANGSGTGNCNGIGLDGYGNGTSSWATWACIGDGSGYDAVYDTNLAWQGIGYFFVHDHSATRPGLFTGWMYWSGPQP